MTFRDLFFCDSDCEYPLLSVRILHLIGDLGPSTPFPSRYIRFIFNRVLLETPNVRAAAVSCLAKCAVDQPRLKQDIHQLMQRSLNDEDDEVRDRATLYCALLEQFKEIKTVTAPDVNEDEDYVHLAEDEAKDEEEEKRGEEVVTITYEAPKELVGIVKVDPPPFDLRQMESSLLIYLNDNEEKEANGESSAFGKAFGNEDVTQFIQEEHKANMTLPGQTAKGPRTGPKDSAQQPDPYGQVRSGYICSFSFSLYDAMLGMSGCCHAWIV